ncbi:MAG TPA: ACP synthase 2, partial [Cupriavidus sp.]|nr:ACP synthase 2 [Cupriavidus sp.]
ALPELLRESDADARLVAFFQLWTLKEAWIKCHGGNLFQTMMGHVVEALPAPISQANAVTWRRDDAVLALAASAPVDGLGLPDATGWRLRERDAAD